LDKKLPYPRSVEEHETYILCCVCFYVSHMVFETVKEDGVNMPEFLRSVYIS